MRLFYRQPAGRWEETLPVGNGKQGGMVWGTVPEERIGLNDENLWSGYPRDKNRPHGGACLEEVREKIFRGEYRQAGRDLEKNLLGEFTESYLPLGDLKICHTNWPDAQAEGGLPEGCSGYERELSLDEGMVSARFLRDGVLYRRKVFASYPAKALAVIWESEGGTMDLQISLESQLQCCMEAKNSRIVMRGQCPEHVDPEYVQRENTVIQGERGMHFQGICTVTECDGSVEEAGESLRISGATRMVLIFQSQVGEELEMWEKQEQEAAAGPSGRQMRWQPDGPLPDRETLEREHLEDYQRLYRRVELSLGEDVDLPTDVRLQRLKDGGDDPALFALYYQYGRYLLISSSRGQGMPANLQGIWNWMLRAPWSSNYTTNINVEMNYWPALSGGLSECLEPYFSFIERIIPNGEKTAGETFGCRGFCVNHNTDFWGVTNPVGQAMGEPKAGEDTVCYAFFPLAGLWMCQEYFRYYEYTGDEEFLRNRAYPVLRKAALFAVDWLTEHEGYYVTCPSTSPENCFLDEDGRPCFTAYGGTMDMTLIREVFRDFRKTCEILNLPDALLDEIAKKEPALLPYQTGSQGQLLEWCREFPEREPGHRHLSHLYGLFPSELFEEMPQWKAPARKSLEIRLRHGGGHTGWSCGWIINLYAILGEGEKAYEYLKVMLKRSTYPNLWDDCPPFQIDGNFGGAAGIANMLAQDRNGKVTLLPAIPKEWKNGSVRGLRIKNGRAVDIRWENGEIVESRIYPVED